MCCRCRRSGGRWGAPTSPSLPPAIISCCHPRGLCVEGRGGVSWEGRTAPGDGAGGDGAARRGWRRGRSRRFRKSVRGGGCGEPTGRGCAVFTRKSRAPARDRVHRCFFKICCFCVFFPTIFLRWHAPRLLAALAPSLIIYSQGFMVLFTWALYCLHRCDLTLRVCTDERVMVIAELSPTAGVMVIETDRGEVRNTATAEMGGMSAAHAASTRRPNGA